VPVAYRDRVKRVFNTAGACDPAYHYMVPPEQRLPEARRLVDEMGYFVVHAPRQTGKTTVLLALARALTAEGRYAALHFTAETAKVTKDDFGAAEVHILDAIQNAAHQDLPRELWPPEWPESAPGRRIYNGLSAWATTCPRPLVLVFDEIDALLEESMVSVLSQLRAGYHRRPRQFPWSIVLCGLRDVRDYKVSSGGSEPRMGSTSPFNIKVESLRLGDFSEEALRALYAQHTAESGQAFTDDAQARSWTLTAGQPWLVNALAREIVRNMAVPPTEAITADHVETAKERIILARQTHLDSLVARLMEPRVKRVIEPLLAGEAPPDNPYDDDLRYTRDLGLIAPDFPVRIANPIYREVIARVLAGHADPAIVTDPRSFVRPDGRFDLDRMLNEFAAFWIEHGEVLTSRMPYHEVAPQLVLMAYLQRVVNGGGYIDREYGVGRGRIDLLVRWPYTAADGKRTWQREALELKVWADGKPDPLAKGLAQLDGYLDRLSLDTGALVLFDRREAAAAIDARTRRETATTPAGRTVKVLRA
jgi:DNA polymerase III delta prime subunit